MKIDIRFRHLRDSSALRDYTLRRIRFHLHRFAGELREVDVRIGDINGPKSGPDKQCIVRLRTDFFGSAAARTLKVASHEAIDLAIKKAARSLGRKVDRDSDRQVRRPRLAEVR